MGKARTTVLLRTARAFEQVIIVTRDQHATHDIAMPADVLVVECVTMSMPNSSGRCRIGVANVVSQTVIAFGTISRTKADSAARSEIFISGWTEFRSRPAAYSAESPREHLRAA